MRILVTGGAGFIGSHLVDRLVHEQHDVVVLDDFSTGRIDHLESALRSGLDRENIVDLDIRHGQSGSALRAFKPDVVVHLAAQSRVNMSMRDPRFDFDTNVVGTLNLLEAARAAGVGRMLFASSGGTIYGAGGEHKDRAIEDTPKSPSSFYGLSKYVGGEYLRLYQRHFGIEYVALALGNVYGPRQSADGESCVVSTFVGSLSRGRECTVNGDGHAVRDYVYVSDAVDAFVRALNRGSGLINVGSGTGTSVNEIYRLVAARLGTTRPPTYGPALPGEARRIVLNPSRARRVLGWRATVPLADGIAATVRSRVGPGVGAALPHVGTLRGGSGPDE